MRGWDPAIVCAYWGSGTGATGRCQLASFKMGIGGV